MGDPAAGGRKKGRTLGVQPEWVGLKMKATSAAAIAGSGRQPCHKTAALPPQPAGPFPSRAKLSPSKP